MLLPILALAGCTQKAPDDDMTPPGDTVSITVATEGVPSNALPGVEFSFTLKATGRSATSDHLGAHYGMNSSTSPSAQVYDKACVHQSADVPGTFTVKCTIAETGTWYLRGHVRLGTDPAFEHFWGPENRVTVGASPGTLTKLVVGTDAAFAPFEDLDTATGYYVGFDMDLMREIGNRSGFSVEFQNLGFDPLIPALKNGQIDAAISAMSITSARQEEVDFSLAYYEANQSVSVRSEDDGKYADLDSMEGKGLKFGAQTGTVGADQVVEHFGEAALTRYDSYPLAIEALKRGDVQAVVMDAPAQKEAAKGGGIVVAFEFSVGDEYGVAVKKGNAVLLAKINTALTTIFADGTYDDLREKWGI
ncbi:MAG TPA: basic amino acid ABC transporter substrate-binding protein [Candidatus Thermoplasmatota archaeon]|nr:basic amino acid ABC transporter substrate-binding protein [Candidatus Thermoplasmatota archaeon]